MSRVRNPITVLGPDGRPLAGASVHTINRPAGTDATVYAADTGATLGSNPATTDARGRVTQFLGRGAYTSVVSAAGMTTYNEVWDAAPAADGAIDTAWMAAGAATPTKVAVSGVHVAGVFAARPAAGAVADGVRFTATDKRMEWQAVAGAWVLLAAHPVAVTALPAAPIDEQRIRLRPDAASHPHVCWDLAYDAAANVWRFVGGSPIAYRPAGWVPADVGEVDTAAPSDHSWTPPKGGRFRIAYRGLVFNGDAAGAAFAMTVIMASASQHAGAGVGTRATIPAGAYSDVAVATITDEQPNGSIVSFRYRNDRPSVAVSASYVEIAPLYLLT